VRDKLTGWSDVEHLVDENQPMVCN